MKKRARTSEFVTSAVAVCQKAAEPLSKLCERAVSVEVDCDSFFGQTEQHGLDEKLVWLSLHEQGPMFVALLKDELEKNTDPWHLALRHELRKSGPIRPRCLLPHLLR